MEATEQYFPVVLLIMPYKVVLTFESVNDILKCEYLNGSYGAVPQDGTVYCAVQSAKLYVRYETEASFIVTGYDKLTCLFVGQVARNSSSRKADEDFPRLSVKP